MSGGCNIYFDEVNPAQGLPDDPLYLTNISDNLTGSET